MKSNLKSKRVSDQGLLDSYKLKPCLICSAIPSDPCHIKSKGSGGDDTSDNIVPLCRTHHTEQHKVGWTTFYEKHPIVRFHLSMLGWTIVGRRLRKYID